MVAVLQPESRPASRVSYAAARPLSQKRVALRSRSRPRFPESAYPRFPQASSGHRCYDPASCKWLSPDPLGESAGLNITAFCRNEPVGKTDPFGLRIRGGTRYIGTYESVGGFAGTEDGSPVSYVYTKRGGWIDLEHLEAGIKFYKVAYDKVKKLQADIKLKKLKGLPLASFNRVRYVLTFAFPVVGGRRTREEAFKIPVDILQTYAATDICRTLAKKWAYRDEAFQWSLGPIARRETAYDAEDMPSDWLGAMIGELVEQGKSEKDAYTEMLMALEPLSPAEAREVLAEHGDLFGVKSQTIMPTLFTADPIGDVFRFQGVAGKDDIRIDVWSAQTEDPAIPYLLPLSPQLVW